MNQNRWYVVGLVAFFAIVALVFVALPRRDVQQNQNTVCDGDAKMCPDGTVVGRVPPGCQFAECPGVKPITDDQPLKGIAVLSGTVTLSPTCPVERTPPDPQCAPKPYVTEVVAVYTGSGKQEASTKTTPDGKYVFDLAPGSYTVQARSAAVYPRCTDGSITLKDGERQTLDISCDTGIR